jgi:hypothetical protein
MTIHPCFTHASYWAFFCSQFYLLSGELALEEAMSLYWAFFCSQFYLLSGELALEEAMGLSRDRQCNA